MATIQGSTNNSNWTFKLDVYELSYDINSNASVVRVDVYIGRASSSSYCGGTFSGSINVDGQIQNYSGTIAYSTTVAGGGWLYTGITRDFTIGHNADGSKSVGVSASWGADFNPSSASASGSLGLTTIPRASGIACSSPNIGDTAVITIDRKSNSFTHTVTYLIGNLSGTIATKSSETVLSFVTSELKEQIYALIPNATEVRGTVYCETYGGNTKIGSTKSAAFTLYAKKDECKPTVTGTIIDTNENTIAITGDNTKLIKYISKPKVTINATPNKSATIKSYLINLNDGQTSNMQENTFDSINSTNVTINAIDSRNYDNPTNIDLSEKMINYIKLHIDNISLDRPEDTSNEIVLNANGVWFNDSFNEDNINSLSINYQYKASNDTEWSEIVSVTPTIEGNTFKFENLSLGNVYDFDTEYQFKVIVSDLLMEVGNSISDVITVPKGQEVVAIGDDSVWVYDKLFLKDILINNLIEYSEEEQRIGTWLNGEPLYKKTIVSKAPVGNSTIDISSLNVNLLIDYKAILERNANSRDFEKPYYNSASDYFRVFFRNSNNIEVRSQTTYGEVIIYVTFIYTKITDIVDIEEVNNEI